MRRDGCPRDARSPSGCLDNFAQCIPILMFRLLCPVQLPGVFRTGRRVPCAPLGLEATDRFTTATTAERETMRKCSEPFWGFPEQASQNDSHFILAPQLREPRRGPPLIGRRESA